MLSRMNTSWVIPVEHPLVGWLAPKLPDAVTPDHLTLIGFIGALICGLAYSASWLSPVFLWVASAGLIINWFGDSLDGNFSTISQNRTPQIWIFYR